MWRFRIGSTCAAGFMQYKVRMCLSKPCYEHPHLARLRRARAMQRQFGDMERPKHKSCIRKENEKVKRDTPHRSPIAAPLTQSSSRHWRESPRTRWGRESVTGLIVDRSQLAERGGSTIYAVSSSVDSLALRLPALAKRRLRRNLGSTLHGARERWVVDGCGRGRKERTKRTEGGGGGGKSTYW